MNKFLRNHYLLDLQYKLILITQNQNIINNMNLDILIFIKMAKKYLIFRILLIYKITKIMILIGYLLFLKMKKQLYQMKFIKIAINIV